MAYDTSVEARADQVVSGWNVSVIKKKMFGGMAYMVQGNLAFGVLEDELIIRAPEDKTTEYMEHDGVHEFTFGRGHAKNIFMAGGDNLEEPVFSELLQAGRDYALSLPPK